MGRIRKRGLKETLATVDQSLLLNEDDDHDHEEDDEDDGDEDDGHDHD